MAPGPLPPPAGSDRSISSRTMWWGLRSVEEILALGPSPIGRRSALKPKADVPCFADLLRPLTLSRTGQVAPLRWHEIRQKLEILAAATLSIGF